MLANIVARKSNMLIDFLGSALPSMRNLGLAHS